MVMKETGKNIHTKSRHGEQRNNTPFERRRPVLRVIRVVVKVDIVQSVNDIAIIVIVIPSDHGVVPVVNAAVSLRLR